MKMIEPVQRKLMHIAQTQLGLSEDNYRLIISAQTDGRKTSSTKLTYFEADKIINYFVKTLGFKIQSNYIRTSGQVRRARWQAANGQRRVLQNPGNVVMMPSRDQLDMIDTLAKKITWRFEDGYDRWLQRYMKIKRIKTAQQASDTIEGLKGLLKNQTQRDNHPQPPPAGDMEEA